MNRIYKVIWNKSKQCYTVVSELAKSHSKSPSGCTLSRRKVASILSAVMLAGGVMFGTPGIVSASNTDGVITGTGAPGQYIAFADGQGHGFAEAHKNQTITIIDPSTQKEIKYTSTKVSTSDGKVSQWYWVREGYNAQLVENKRYPNANKSYVIEGYKQDNFTGGTQDDVIKNYQSGSQQTNIYTNNGNKISDVKAGVYGGGSNGYTPVESISTNGGKYFFLDKDGKGNWEAAQNDDFVALSKNTTTGLYEYEGKAVDPSKLYSIKVNGKYETGIFINSDKSIYTGAVYGYNNEILLTTYDKTQGKYISYWGAEIVDPKATIGQMTVGTFNCLLDELNTNIKNVQKENIKQIDIAPVEGGGTIGLTTMGDVDANGYPKGGEAVPGGITITSKDGYNGNDAELIFTNKTPKKYTTDPQTGKISVEEWKENSFTVKAGSTVKALGSENSVGIEVNGKKYTVEAGDNVQFTVDENDPNKYILSVDGTNDAAVIYDENNGSLKSTNSKEVGGGSVALGKEAIAKNNAVAIGDYSKANANGTVAIGFKAQSGSQANQAVTLGYNSYVGKTGAIAIGANSSVDSANEVSVGHKKGDLLGDGTKAKDDLTRKIINVSAGVNDTDAVNVSQLKDVADEAAKHTTLDDGKNTTVEKTVTDGQLNYKVNLNDDVILGNIDSEFVSISGTKGTIQTSGDITIGSNPDNKNVVIHAEDQTITGLSNTTWDANKVNVDANEGGYKGSNKAATESQLQSAVSDINTNIDGKTFGLTADEGTKVDKKLGESIKVAGGKNITTKADGTELTVDLDDHVVLGDKEKSYIDLDGTTGKISAKVKDLFSSESIDFNENGLTISGETFGTSNGTTNIKGDKIRTEDTYGNYTEIDGGSVRTEILEVYPDTNNALKFDSTGLNINSFDTDAKVDKDGVSLSVDNGSGKNNSVKVTADETIFSYTEGGAAAATTTVIKGQQITAGKVLVNSEAGKSTVIGLTNTNITDKGFATAGRAATEEQLKAMGSAEQGGGFGLTDDNGKSVTKSLGETISVKGDKNITTTANNADGSLTVALKENLTGIKTISNGNKTLSITDTGIGFNVINPEDFSSKSIVVTANGTTISGGLSVDGSKITNVADGEISKTSKDAVNGSQLNALDEKWAKEDAGNVKYDKKGDTFDYSNITLGNGKVDEYNNKQGGTVIHNLGYADINEGGAAVNVDLLKDQIAQVKQDAADSDIHVKAGEYTVENNQVSMGLVDGKGNDKGTVTIKDVASAADLGDVGNLNDNLQNKDENGNNTHTSVVDAINKIDDHVKDVDNKVGDLQYDKVEGTEIANGDSTTTAIGKLDNKIDSIGGTAAEADKNTITGGAINSDNGTISLDKKDGSSITLDGKLSDHVLSGASYDKESGKLTITDKDKYSDSTHSVSVDGIASKDDIKGIHNVIGDGDNGVKDDYTNTTYIKDSETLVDADKKLDTAITNVDNASYNRDVQLSNRIDNIDKRLGDVEERIDKVGAMAAAMANLHTMGYDPAAPTEISASIGQYKSETALAVGFFHYPNQDFMLSGSISVAGDEVMAGVGATWKIGRKTQAQLDAKEAERRIIKAAEIKQAAKDAEVKAQAERHAKLLAEREAQAHG